MDRSTTNADVPNDVVLMTVGPDLPTLDAHLAARSTVDRLITVVGLVVSPLLSGGSSHDCTKRQTANDSADNCAIVARLDRAGSGQPQDNDRGSANNRQSFFHKPTPLAEGTSDRNVVETQVNVPWPELFHNPN